MKNYCEAFEVWRNDYLIGTARTLQTARNWKHRYGGNQIWKVRISNLGTEKQYVKLYLN